MFRNLFLAALAIAATTSVWLVGEVGLKAKYNTAKELRIGIRYPVPIRHDRISHSLTWEQELTFFSKQLERGFGIPANISVKYAPVIMSASINTGLSEYQIASWIMTESSFRSKAVSSVGAYGATQIRPEFWEEFCVNKDLDLYTLEGNVLCGAEILTELRFKFCNGDLECGLSHYNVGRTNLLSSNEYRKAGMRYNTKIEAYSRKLALINL